MNRMKGIGLLAALLCLSSPGSAAQPLKLINPYPATGAVDIAGTVIMNRALRAMQDRITPSATDALVEHLRQSLAAGLGEHVVVERNQRQGGAAAARQLVARDALLFSGSGLAAAAAQEALSGLRPLALVGRIPVVLVVRGDTSGNLAQLAGRSGEEPLQIGLAGERGAGLQALVGMRGVFRRQLVPVSYNGGEGALRGLLATQVTAVLAPLPAVLPHAAGHRLRILALASAARHRVLQHVPTFIESGFPGVMAAGWHGLFSSSATPDSDLLRLRTALGKTWAAEDSRQAIARLGYEPDLQGAAVLRALLAGDLAGEIHVPSWFSARIPPAASPR